MQYLQLLKARFGRQRTDDEAVKFVRGTRMNDEEQIDVWVTLCDISAPKGDARQDVSVNAHRRPVTVNCSSGYACMDSYR